MIVLESMCTHMNSKTVPSPHVQTHETQLMPGTEVVSSDGSQISNTKIMKYILVCVYVIVTCVNLTSS